MERPIFDSAREIGIAVERCKEKMVEGARQEELVVYLHDQGFSILDAIKIVKQVFGTSLGEAKRIVTGHPIWALEARSMNALHEELVNTLENEDRLSP